MSEVIYKKLLDSRAGLRDCLEYLKRKKNYAWRGIHPINNGRYYIVSGEPNIAVIFKHEFFLKFGEFASARSWVNDNGKLESGIGDSINTDDLRTIIQNDVKTIYVTYDDGKIYYIDTHEFLLKSHSWQNKEGKLVRSISIHNLKRLNGD